MAGAIPAKLTLPTIATITSFASFIVQAPRVGLNEWVNALMPNTNFITKKLEKQLFLYF
jgi:hypothetical protein